MTERLREFVPDKRTKHEDTKFLTPVNHKTKVISGRPKDGERTKINSRKFGVWDSPT